MMKKTSLFLSSLLLSFTILSSIGPANAATNFESSQNTINLVIDNEPVSVKLLSETKSSLSVEINAEGMTDIAEIDYINKSFTILDEDGNKTIYNAEDFISELTEEDTKHVEKYSIKEEPIEGEEINFNNLNYSIEGNSIMPLNSNSSRNYYGDIQQATGVYGTWYKNSTNIVSGKTIDTMRGVVWSDTKTVKKMEFTKGTAFAVVTAAVLAFWKGFTYGSVLAALGGVGIALVQGYLGTDLTIFVKAEQVDIGRGFYVQHEGFPTVTKSYSLYVNILGPNNQTVREEYKSGGFAFFYNDWSDASVAKVAYQQYLYITGKRSTYPKASEF